MTVRCDYFAYDTLQRLLCVRLYAATTFPTTLCNTYNPYATTLPTALCSDYFAYDTLQQLLCLRASVATMTPMRLH